MLKNSLSRLGLEERIVGPVPYHGRFHLEFLPEDSILQHQLRHSKCLKFYTTMIAGEKNLPKKSVNFVKIEIATNCRKFEIIHLNTQF